MSAHAATWSKVSNLLREVRDCLKPRVGGQGSVPIPDGPLVGTIQEAAEFLNHNELELAWDALAEVAAQVDAPPTCWHKLVQAARLMRLPDKANAAAQRATPSISCDQALAVAHLDAEKAYRELLDYRITIVLQLDGWHIDYELAEPMMSGGGPHYVIDPASGAILSKRYEQ